MRLSPRLQGAGSFLRALSSWVFSRFPRSFRPALAARFGDRLEVEPELDRLLLNGTLAVIYTPYDLGAGWERVVAPYAVGYEPAGATRLRVSTSSSIRRLLTSVVALSLALAAGESRAASRSPGSAAAAEVWPLEVVPLDAASLGAQGTRLDGLGGSLPPELTPAVRYQKTFVRILSGAPEGEWADEMRHLAEAPGDDGLTRGLREVGKFWVARLEMKQIGETLSGFYIHEIRFPEKLSLVEADLPANIRRDPWGEPWFYQLKTQDQFASPDGQGYQLGPARLPALSLLRHIRQARRLVPPAWKISAVSVGGRSALEFRGAAGTALIQPGSMADGCTLLYIGSGWALMAQADQLFTITY